MVLPQNLALYLARPEKHKAIDYSCTYSTIGCLARARHKGDYLGGRFGFFFCSGEGKGESEAPGRGGVGFFLRIPGGWDLPRGGGGVCEGPGGLQGFRGRGAKYLFFRGRNAHQAMEMPQES